MYVACTYTFMNSYICMYMVHTRSWIYIFVCLMYIHVHALIYFYVHDTYSSVQLHNHTSLPPADRSWAGLIQLGHPSTLQWVSIGQLAMYHHDVHTPCTYISLCMYHVHTFHVHGHTVYIHVHTLYMGTTYFIYIPLWYMPVCSALVIGMY